MIKKQKAMESTWSEKTLDAYESWLARQPVKEVKGKSGFIGTQEIGGTQRRSISAPRTDGEKHIS